MQKFVNYFGQLRFYSAIDLIFLLVALRANQLEIVGIICLWFGFLLLLEQRHAHQNRMPFLKFLFVPLFLIAFFLLPSIPSILFILSSYGYTEKKNKSWGVISPLFRGLQGALIVYAVTRSIAPLVFFVFGLFAVRNIIGDLRDVEKDLAQGIKTLPILWGQKISTPYIHLGMTLTTTTIWWQMSTLSVSALLLALPLEIFLYKLTPR